MPPTKDEHIQNMLRIWRDWYAFVAKAVHENRLRLPDTIAISAIRKLQSIPTPMEAASWCADVADALTTTQYTRSKAFADKLLLRLDPTYSELVEALDKAAGEIIALNKALDDADPDDPDFQAIRKSSR